MHSCMDAELQAAREALARELYAYRCGDSGLAPTRHGLNLFLAAVVKQAAGTEKAAGRTLRLRGLQLGPRSGKAIARALCGSDFGGLDLFNNPSLGDSGAAALLPLLGSGQITSVRLGACGLRSGLQVDVDRRACRTHRSLALSRTQPSRRRSLARSSPHKTEPNSSPASSWAGCRPTQRSAARRSYQGQTSCGPSPVSSRRSPNGVLPVPCTHLLSDPPQKTRTKPHPLMPPRLAQMHRTRGA